MKGEEAVHGAAIKVGDAFVERGDSQHPKRKPRKIHVHAISRYCAHVAVVEGRGKGHVLALPLKRIVDPEQWTREPPAVCPRCKGAGHYFAPGDYAPLEDVYCCCAAAEALRSADV